MTKAELKTVLNSIVTCKDARYVKEIFAKKESFNASMELSGKVRLMVVVDLDFENHDLYQVINQAEDNYDGLVISVEPNDAERSYGPVLWKRG